jgi:hypothetical protein
MNPTSTPTTSFTAYNPVPRIPEEDEANILNLLMRMNTAVTLTYADLTAKRKPGLLFPYAFEMIECANLNAKILRESGHEWPADIARTAYARELRSAAERMAQVLHHIVDCAEKS